MHTNREQFQVISNDLCPLLCGHAHAPEVAELAPASSTRYSCNRIDPLIKTQPSATKLEEPLSKVARSKVATLQIKHDHTPSN